MFRLEAGQPELFGICYKMPPNIITPLVSGSSSLPLMDGIASAGTSANFSRGDHVHPTDTTRAPLTYTTGRGIRLAEYGNSFTSRGFSPGPNPVQIAVNGLGPMLEAISQGAFRLPSASTNMLGFSGQTSTYLANNYTTNIPPIYNNFDWLLMWGSAVNDTALTPAQSLANIQAIQAQLAANGKVLLLGTPYFTRSGANYTPTATQTETIAQTNRIIAAWARKTPGVVYFDFWNDVVLQSQVGAVARPGMQDTDGLHPTALAVQVIAKRALAVCAPFIGSPLPFMGQMDVYDPTNNLGGNVFSTLSGGAANNLCQGTTGTIGTGCSGTLPTNWSISRGSGTDTIVCNTIANNSGYGSIGGNSFSIGVNNAAAACSFNAAIYPNLPAGLVGQMVESLLLVNVLAGPANGMFTNFQWGFFPNYGNTGSASWGLEADLVGALAWISGESLLIRTPPVLASAAANSPFQFQLNGSFVAGASGSFTFSQPVFRLYQP